MTLSDLAAIGSFVSGVAVVITLVFLVIQMRLNTAALKRAEYNAAQTAASAFRMTIVDNRDVATLLTAALAQNGNLDETDNLRLQHLLTEILWFSWLVWDRQQTGLFSKDDWKATTPLFTDLLIAEQGAAWWNHYKSGCPPAFRADVDTAIAARRDEIA